MLSYIPPNLCIVFLIPYGEICHGACGIAIMNMILMGDLLDECVSWVAALQKYVYINLFLSRRTSSVKDKITVVIFVEFFSLYVQSVYYALI